MGQLLCTQCEGLIPVIRERRFLTQTRYRRQSSHSKVWAKADRKNQQIFLGVLRINVCMNSMSCSAIFRYHDVAPLSTEDRLHH